MKKIALISILVFLTQIIDAQSLDSLMKRIEELPGDRLEKIAAARQQLDSAFVEEDYGLVNAWLGFLQNSLETDENAATLSDERWLLYFWTENFGQLFGEVAGFEEKLRQQMVYQAPPPPDDLFEKVDKRSFERRFELYNNLRRAFLSEEEKAFGVLLLDYLLRTDSDPEGEKEQAVKASAFFKNYPKSRFKNYVNSFIYSEVKLGKGGFGADVTLNYGRNSGAYGVNFSPLWHLNVGLTYWHQRFNFTGRFSVGSHKVRREFRESGFYVVPDTSATVYDFGLETAFDLIENDRLKIAPMVGWGFARELVSREPTFSEDFDLKLEFNTFYWTAGVILDWKFARWHGSRLIQTGKPTSWASVRFRLGYKRLRFGEQNPELGGSQIFIGVGAAVFGRAVKG